MADGRGEGRMKSIRIRRNVFTSKMRALKVLRTTTLILYNRDLSIEWQLWLINAELPIL